MTKIGRIEAYLRQGKTTKEILQLHPDWGNYVYEAVTKIRKRTKAKEEAERVIRPEGWNEDRHACKSCMYRGRGCGKHSLQNKCNYILVEGHRRGCKVADCNVYVKGKAISLNKCMGSERMD